jgi:hypothetical protein
MMGLYLDRPPHMVDPKGLSACNNVRIEFAQVRSDLLGWEASAYPQLPAACIYLSRFVNSAGSQRTIAVTPTDLILLSTTAPYTYLTPPFSSGTVSVSNGGTTVTGTNTGWTQDIQGGWAYLATQNSAAGATTLTLNPLGNTRLVPLSVQDQTAPTAIPVGTYTANATLNLDGSVTLGLTQPLVGAVSIGDTIYVGSGVNLRPSAQAGDQISFGVHFDNSLTSTWYTILSVNSDTSITLATAYGGTTLVNSFYTIRECLTNTLSGSSPFVPTCSSVNFPNGSGPTPGGAPGQWLTGDDFWFFTNGIDPIVVWGWQDPHTTYSTTIPLKAASLVQTRGLLILGGLINGLGVAEPTSIANSDNGFPLKFAGGVAFQGVACDGPFNITRLATLGSTLMIYCTGTWGGAPTQQDDQSGEVVSGSFVGFPTIWAFSDIIKTRGPVCGNAVVEFPDRHQFLTTDGELRYNGLFIQVMNDHVWRAVMKSFDATRPGSCYAYVQPTNGDLIWGVPLATDPVGQLYPTTAYVEHYMEQANSYLFKPMTQRDFPFLCVGAFQNPTIATFGSATAPGGGVATFGNTARSWLSFGQAGNTPQYLVGDIAGNIWQLYVANTQNGSPALCTATWGSRAIGNGRSRSLLTRIYPEIDYIANPLGTISVTVAMQDAAMGPITITDTRQFDATYSGNRFTSHMRRGREVAVTISDQLGIGWATAGYDFDWVTGGER